MRSKLGSATSKQDPSADKKAQKEAELAAETTFQKMALEWSEKHEARWNDSYAEKVRGRLEKQLFPWIGNKPINAITPVIRENPIGQRRRTIGAVTED